ncbi:class I SAM-dependent methyltransferase [Candidatus Pseudothioglobus singularis]|nr:class I SAM-dependent methyltransferase [Candidatus Pseudothioglobus singularis]
MIRVMKFIFINKLTAFLFRDLILKIHNLSYKLSAIFSTILNDGVHPKHYIILYEKWFIDNVKKHDIVVDVGSNMGYMVDKLSEKVEFIYGLEIDEKLCKKAQLSVQKNNVKFICCDATIYDYANCKGVTVVTMSNVLEHIESRVEFLNKIVKNVQWNLDYDKKLLIRVPMVDRDWITIYKKQIGIEYRLDKTHYTEYTYTQFKDELKKSNIKIISHHIQYGELYAVCRAE